MHKCRNRLKHKKRSIQKIPDTALIIAQFPQKIKIDKKFTATSRKLRYFIRFTVVVAFRTSQNATIKLIKLIVILVRFASILLFRQP